MLLNSGGGAARRLPRSCLGGGEGGGGEGGCTNGIVLARALPAPQKKILRQRAREFTIHDTQTAS